VIVPTKYYKTPTEKFSEWNVNLVIWANHNLRASVKAMQDTCKNIYENENLLGVEGKVATVKEIFRIQDEEELKNADKKYL